MSVAPRKKKTSWALYKLDKNNGNNLSEGLPIRRMADTLSRFRAEYMQKPDETVEDWQYRLMLGKARKKVDLSWDELAKMLDYGSGQYIRKLAYGIVRYVDYLKEKIQLGEELDDNEVQIMVDELQSIDKKVFQLKSETIRVRDQRREFNKVLREQARSGHIQDQVTEAVNNLAKIKPLVFDKIPSKAGTREAALLMSDWHKGVNSLNYWNEFNDIEFQKRVKILTEKTIRYAKDHNVSKLHCFLLGDLVHGLIHVTARIASTENSVMQTKLVAETLSYVFAEFAKEFNAVRVYSARGNHERISANIKESVAGESFFDMIPWYLKARLGHIKNIVFVENEYDEEIIVTNICGQHIFAVHGHRDKLPSAVQNLSLMLRIFPDFIFMGHYHQNMEKEVHSADIVVNPSLSGVDEYAKELRLTGKPAQKLLIFDKDDGRLCTYPIKLVS